jgi:hypothetical protein
MTLTAAAQREIKLLDLYAQWLKYSNQNTLG